jgi:hypothetical protein
VRQLPSNIETDSDQLVAGSHESAGPLGRRPILKKLTPSNVRSIDVLEKRKTAQSDAANIENLGATRSRFLVPAKVDQSSVCR